LKCGEYGTAQEFAQKVLANTPENSQAMAISGYAYHKQGNPEKALSLLDRAIETNNEDSEPWLLRADLYAETGETAKSVSTLRSALTAHSENELVRTRLVKTLIENGQASEALSILGEFQPASITNKELALLRLSAVKQLNLSELANLAEQLYQVFPDDAEIIKEYALAQLAKGNKETVKKLLESATATGAADPDLALAYCDAMLG
jgi:Flp pilus assembly protein TadD